jgi:hypothetical protein
MAEGLLYKRGNYIRAGVVVHAKFFVVPLLVASAGIEPATLGLADLHSVQLRYEAKRCHPDSNRNKHNPCRGSGDPAATWHQSPPRAGFLLYFLLRNHRLRPSEPYHHPVIFRVYQNFVRQYHVLMIQWSISEFVDDRGHGVVSRWFNRELKNEIVREKFEGKLLLVIAGGPDLALNALGGTNERHIDKIRVTGRINIRVLYCRGPGETEITLLVASREKDDKLEPNVLERAEERRKALVADERRRQPYVFRKKKTPRNAA